MDRIKVLLIDDDLDLLDLIGTRIEGWGYELARASSGKEGLAAIELERPDIIVLDYIMPDMDGIAVLQGIRKNDRNIPVIMFTAYPDAVTVSSMEKLNITAFIPKLSVYSDTQVVLKTAIASAAKKVKKQ